MELSKALFVFRIVEVCRYLDALLALDRLGLSDICDLLVTGILSLSEQHLEMVKLSTSETSSEK